MIRHYVNCERQEAMSSTVLEQPLKSSYPQKLHSLFWGYGEGNQPCTVSVDFPCKKAYKNIPPSNVLYFVLLVTCTLQH